VNLLGGGSLWGYLGGSLRIYLWGETSLRVLKDYANGKTLRVFNGKGIIPNKVLLSFFFGPIKGASGILRG